MSYFIFLKSLRSLEEFRKIPHVKIPPKSPCANFQSLCIFENLNFIRKRIFLHFRPNGPERPQGQQNYTYGKVNHVTTEEAQQAQDVVLGMFLASSHPVTVLFNSGASHSFISSSFVVRHQLPITILKQTMLVSSPGGEMRTKYICPAISITIRG
jgi:hypothetical protein